MKIYNSTPKNIVLISLFISLSMCNSIFGQTDTLSGTISTTEIKKVKRQLLKPVQDQKRRERQMIPPREGVSKKPEKIQYGLTIVENAKLRMDADTNSQIIKTLPYATPFQVLEEKHIYVLRKHSAWYRIKTIDNKNNGWIFFREGRIGISKADSLSDDDYPQLYYAVACQSFWGYSDYIAAERLYLDILTHFPDRQIFVDDESSGREGLSPAKNVTLKRLAELSKARKQFHKAIAYYEQFLSQANISRHDSLMARRAIMMIYNNSLNDSLKTIELCHRFIRECPNELLSGDEWNLWMDIEAADIIERYYLSQIKDIRQLSEESQKILTETSNPPVILLATQGNIIYQLYCGDYDSAKRTLLKTLSQYPSEIRYYFKTPVNFSIGLLERVVEWLLDKRGDYETAIDFVKTVKDSIRNPEMENFCYFKIARLLDEGHGDRETVLASYEKSIAYGTRWYTTDLRKWVIDREDILRFEAVKRYTPVAAKVTEQNTILKPGLRSPESDFKLIPRKTELTILYKDESVCTVNNKIGNWAKVRLANGDIGWVFDVDLSPTVEVSLFAPSKPSEEVWCMSGKDVHRSSAINAKVIKKPALLMTFPKLGNEAVFSDINNDRILDILACSKNGLTVLNGQTQKIIWRFECSNGSVPLIAKSLVFIIAYVKNGEYLYALDRESGKPRWRIQVGNVEHGRSPASPAIDDERIYVGTLEEGLMAINIKNGTLAWRFPTAYPILSDITISGDLVYFLSKDDFFKNLQLYALKTSTGKIEWKYELPSSNYNGNEAGICLEDDKIYCSGSNEYFIALDAKKGRLLWQIQVNEKPRGRRNNSNLVKPSIHNQKVYYATSRNELLAINARTGEILWKYGYNHSLWGRPAIVKNAVYMRSIDGVVHAVSSNDGQLLWQLKVGSEGYGGAFSPTIAQGLIFIGSTDNNLYVIGESH